MKSFIFIVLIFFNTNSIAQIQVGQTITGKYEKEWFGFAVDIDRTGKRVVASSIFFENNIDSIDGIVRVFKLNDEGEWSLVGNEILNDTLGYFFGYDVAISGDGNTIAVSMPSYDTPDPARGAIRVYELLDNSWVIKGQLLIGEEWDREFGFSIDLSNDGNTICASAPHVNVKCYTFVNNLWKLKGLPINYPLSSALISGYKVMISDNGNKVATSFLTGQNSTEKSSVSIYEYKNDDWSIIGEPLTSSLDDYHLYASEYAISDNGKIVAIKEDNSIYDKIEFYELKEGKYHKMESEIIGSEGFWSIGDNICLSDDGKIALITSDDYIYMYKFIDEKLEKINSGISINTNHINSTSLSGNGDFFVCGATGYNNFTGLIKVYKNELTSIINQDVEKSKTIIYPNPVVSTLFYKNIQTQQKCKSIKIYRSDGILIKNVECNRKNINLSDLNYGIYYIEFIYENGEKVINKVVKT